MQLALRNKLFSFISLSRIFNTLGASIFNIVFVVFASSMPNPKFAIAVANFIVLVPTFFTIFVGIKADKTIHKADSFWLCTSPALYTCCHHDSLQLLSSLFSGLLHEYSF